MTVDKSWAQTTTSIFYSHYSGTRRNKRKQKKKNYTKQKDRDNIAICTIFESVCNSQSNTAFELAAAYL